MIRKILYFNLFTAATNTYVAWAFLFDTSVANITLFFIITSMFATIGFFNRSNFIEVKKWVKYLLLLLIVMPLILSFGNYYVNYNKIILSLYYIFIFLNGYAFFKLMDRKIVVNFFSFTLAFTQIFGIVSMLNPEFFYPLANIIDADFFYGGRAFGFFLQPNSYAFANVMLFFGFAFFSSNLKNIQYLYLAVLISIILSGSRSNLLGFVVISLFSMRPLLLKFFNKKLLVIIVIGLSSLIFTALYESEIKNFVKSDKFDTISFRVNSLINSEGINQSLTTGSVKVRERKQGEYKLLVQESPIYGHGFGIQRDYVKKGILEGSAHNVFYEILLEGGIIYMIMFTVFCIFLIRSYRSFKKISPKKIKSVIVLKALLIFLGLSLLFSSSVLSDRLLYVILSIFPFLLSEKKNQKFLK